VDEELLLRDGVRKGLDRDSEGMTSGELGPNVTLQTRQVPERLGVIP